MKLLKELITISLQEGKKHDGKRYEHIIYFKEYHPSEGDHYGNHEQKTIIPSDSPDKRVVMKQFIDEFGSMNILTHQVVDKQSKSYVSEGEKKSSVSKDVASKVYHRDYVKTKNKKYRKYNPAEDNK